MNKIVKSHKCCILCLKSPIKVPHLKLHRFPKNEKKRNVWLNACGLKANDYLPNRTICSRHFDETCYSKNGIQRSRLKLDAIPTKYLTGQIIRPIFQLSPISKTDQLTIEPSVSETSIISKMNEDSQLNIQPSISDIYLIKESTQTTVLSRPSTPELQEIPKRKKNFISKIKTPDLATPTRARKNFKSAKTQIQMQKNKIKILNQNVRRLNKKISSLELLLSHLKQKNLLSEEAHDNILVIFTKYLECVN